MPGLITLIMTLIGTLLTALVVAREWERGTMEAILVTPLRRIDLLLGKVLPYFTLGMVGMGLSVAVAVTLFQVPFRGSIGALILLSSIFMLASLGFGLMISAAIRIQFVAAQISIVAGISAGPFPFGAFVRPGQHAAFHSDHQLRGSGQIFRRHQPHPVHGRRHLVRALAQCPGAGADGAFFHHDGVS